MPCPILVGILVGTAFPIVLFAIEYSIEQRAKQAAKKNGRKIWCTLTPARMVRDTATGEVMRGEGEVDFDPRHGHYMKCGEIIVTLASASLVFIPTLHFTSKLPWLGLPMVLLGFTVVYALSFMGFLMYFYEMFLFNPDNFTDFHSSVIFSLGFGSLCCFAFSYFSLSIIVANALSNGTLITVVR